MAEIEGLINCGHVRMCPVVQRQFGVEAVSIKSDVILDKAGRGETVFESLTLVVFGWGTPIGAHPSRHTHRGTHRAAWVVAVNDSRCRHITLADLQLYVVDSLLV